MTAWFLGRAVRIMSEGGDPLAFGVPDMAWLISRTALRTNLSRLGPEAARDWLLGGFDAPSKGQE